MLESRKSVDSLASISTASRHQCLGQDLLIMQNPNNGPYSDSEYQNTRDEGAFNNITGDRKQITFNDLTSIINASYGNNPDMECSTALDIIALYLHGQKLLYIDDNVSC